MANRGKIVVLEGIDGSGKSAQYRRLSARLEREGIAFRSAVFPRYDQESSALIRMYLSGQFGEDPNDVNAFASSIFYAVDRYASFMTDWKDYYEAGGLMLLDRYTTSNAVHQGAKLGEGEQPAFFDWLYDLEYGKLGLPRPDLVVYTWKWTWRRAWRGCATGRKRPAGPGTSTSGTRNISAAASRRASARPRTTAGGAWPCARTGRYAR